MITLGLVACLLAAAPAPGQPAARTTVQGTLRSAGERLPVAGAKVFASARRGPGWTREAVSDGDGRFLLTDLPSREFTLVVVAAGHQRFEQPTPAAYWSRRKPPTIYLQPQGAGGYRTIVEQERVSKPSPVSTRLQPEEIANLPGSQGDPLRALQNLPGVARVPGGLGLLILRGAAPNQSQVFFGEHPLPRAFHIPGLASIVPAGVIGGIEYVPGNFSAHYGNAVGGIVHLVPRVGRRDGVHGHVKIDLITAGARIEGPFGKGGSFILAAQRGYLDLALRALPEEVSLSGTAVSPRYHDYQFIFDHPVGRGGALTMRLLGAADRFQFRQAFTGEPGLSLSNGFHRVDLAYRQRHGRWDFLLAPAVRFDRTDYDSGIAFLRRRNDVVGLLRAEASVRPWRPLQLTLGVDTQLDHYRSFHRTTAEEGLVDNRTRGFLTNTGVYLNSQLELGRYAIIAGARVSSFTGAVNAKHAVDPRLLLRYSPHERVRIQLAAGTYSQPLYRSARVSAGVFDQWQASSASFGGPTSYFGNYYTVFPAAIRYLDPQLEFNPEGQIGALRSAQYSANLHLELADHVELDATLFHRKVRTDIAPHPENPDAPTNRSTATGVEVMLRHDLTARLFGWIAYTWMRSTTTFNFPNMREPVRVPSDFDQRHNLVVLVGYKLPRRWSIAGRFRLVTGLPFTPFIGSINTDGSWAFNPNTPVYGAPNSARMAVFHQLDLRVDRTWILQRCVVGAYLDVMNVYNHQNAEGVIYSQDFSRTRAAVGLPILPVLGVQVTY
ncbi:TonB-dependent Receptor Plug Domain [Nannocystis exedens]|uniref:TonB-dependent Receptor Plug Domain n=1 Tax=Nannocystis exedens TaxID=54 RepID=A0A1I1Y9E2_9BACT|nr:TonB-dependent receptor [Nannocystis exedens]PCC71907.1 TonB family protein [Nannocystis exedens]SFE16174.1 TonB-dependent Receptor Plug Domain [Nannocystis exedens]